MTQVNTQRAPSDPTRAAGSPLSKFTEDALAKRYRQQSPEMAGRPPRTDEWDWQRHALCRGMDTTVFFAPDGEKGTRLQQREDRARRICQQCPVLEHCRRYALTSHEPYGVWGGLSSRERALHTWAAPPAVDDLREGPTYRR